MKQLKMAKKVAALPLKREVEVAIYRRTLRKNTCEHCGQRFEKPSYLEKHQTASSCARRAARIAAWRARDLDPYPKIGATRGSLLRALLDAKRQ